MKPSTVVFFLIQLSAFANTAPTVQGFGSAVVDLAAHAGTVTKQAVSSVALGAKSASVKVVDGAGNALASARQAIKPVEIGMTLDSAGNDLVSAKKALESSKKMAIKRKDTESETWRQLDADRQSSLGKKALPFEAESKASNRKSVLDEMKKKEMERLKTPSGLKEEQERLFRVHELRVDAPNAAQELLSIRKVQAWQDDLAKQFKTNNQLDNPN